MISGDGRERRCILAIGVILVAALMFAPAISTTSSSTGTPSVPAVVAPLPTPAVTSAGAGHPLSAPAQVGLPPGTGANSSGPGTFYTTRSLPSPSFANETCVGALCYNDSNDVATNYTSRGILAVAYTSLTDRSPCAAQRPYSVSNIAFVTSSNRGTTWSAVRYLGNSVCTGTSTGYPDSWEPALTSLANGTLVLAYVEYNLTAGSLPPLTATAWPPVESRLVVTESYNNGVAWATPQVLNISNPTTAPPGVQYTPALPSVAAFGSTIYVTWMSLSFEDSEGAISLMVSSDGGQVWSPNVPVSTGFGAYYSMDPQALVDRAGELFIAYTTNITYNYFFCGDDGCHGYGNGVWEGSVWVASSATNGTQFDYTMVASSVPLDGPEWGPAVNLATFGPFQTPAPQLAYSATEGQLYLAFTAGRAANDSSFCEGGASDCLVGGLYFYSSSDSGVTWTAGNIRDVVFDPDDIDPDAGVLNSTDTVTSVAIAVTPAGDVDIEASFYNGSTCFGSVCGAATEVVFSTPDNGTTFTEPAVVAAAYTPLGDAWNGEYGAVDVLGSSPLFFWASNSCPAWQTTPCSAYPSSGLPVAQVELSTPFSGSGSTLFFNATGVPAYVNWSISVLGNLRSGGGHETLSVSGVPNGIPILFSAANSVEPQARYEVAAGSLSPASPQTLSGNLGIVVSFNEFIPVTITYQVPSITGIVCGAEEEIGACPTFYPGCSNTFNFDVGCFSLYFTPIPPTGEQWLPIDQPVSIGLSDTPLAATCPNSMFGECELFVYNLTLLGWSGAGSGSISSANTNITFTPTGPVTESASFVLTGVCNWLYYSFFVPPLQYEWCDTFNASFTLAETGLPTGTSWGVTFSGAAGTGSIVAPAGQNIENATAGVGFAGISIWNVPGPNPNEVWVGTTTVGSTILLPYTSTVIVSYTLEPVSRVSVPLEVRTLGLPLGLAGNLTITDQGTGGTSAYSVGTAGVNTSVAGGLYNVNASSIVTTSGISYLVGELYITSGLVNDSNQSALSPATVTLAGPSVITVAYDVENWVDISAGVGGLASPSSRWVTAGSTITLRATPNSGYIFLDWVGTGPGATSGAQATLSQVVVQPGGPLTELAVFAPTPASTWTVTVAPTGLPAGVEATVTLGSTTYTGSGTSFTITNLSTGTYSLALPSVTGIGTAIAEYSLTSVSASVGLSGSQLTVSQDLTLYPVYETQYLVTVTVVGDGTLSFGPGSAWETSGSTLTISATPSAGNALQDWTGASDGGAPQVLSNLTSLQVVITGSLNIVAWFVPAPAPVTSSYSFTLNESGLPAGTAWQFELVGGSGSAGTASALVISGLNGTYQIVVPILYTAPGVRFVPQGTNGTSVTVDQNANGTVAFQEQYLITAAASGPGSVAGGGWYPAGQTVTLSASLSGAAFAGWQGNGPGSYSGMSLTPKFVATGPVSETATFSTSAPTSSSSGAPTPVVDYLVIAIVIAVLLAVGIAEGYVAGRKRRPPQRGIVPPSPPAAPAEAPSTTVPAGVALPPPPADGASWSEN
jgi:hypothetical protein